MYYLCYKNPAMAAVIHIFTCKQQNNGLLRERVGKTASLFNMIHHLQHAAASALRCHRSLRQTSTQRCIALQSTWWLRPKSRQDLLPSREFNNAQSITAISRVSSSSSSVERYFHSSSTPQSDSFHGLSINEDATSSKTVGSQERHPSSISKIDVAIPEAQVVKTERDKRRTHDLIAELVRAEILSYSSPRNDEDKGTAVDGAGDAAANTNNTARLGPYERQMQQLRKAMENHSTYSKEDDPVRYAKSCRDLGELNYRMGRMEQCQDTLLVGLRVLMDSDTFSEGKENENEVRLIKAQIMHCLGAVMARCGEYDEAFQWYEESLQLKRDMLNESPQSQTFSVDDPLTSVVDDHHYEMGKTLNGLAALEVMSGGDAVDCEKAMTLFRDAERHYLHRYRQFSPMSETIELGASRPNDDLLSVSDWYSIPEAVVKRMTPHLVQLVINVRSNMGELLRQQGRHSEAVEIFRMALDLAQMDVIRMANTRNGDALSSNTAELKSKSTDELHSLSIEITPEERRNAVVELLIKVADSHVAYENYDEAAASYEQALASHVAFRNLTDEEGTQCTDNLLNRLNERLPAAASVAVEIPLDISNATTVEAAIRNNLAHALVRIDQEKLALKHYEIALQIKRHIGGDDHIEVAHTLMEMGALLGGPMKDVATSLNCFKEALYIYRCKLDDLTGTSSYRSENSRLPFYDADHEIDEINEHVYNASRNIALIEDALLKDRDGVSKSNRR